MKRMMRLGPIMIALGLVTLTACAPAPGSGSTQEERPADPPEGQPDDPIAADDCLVGDWLLDVAEFSAESNDYLVGLGIPITGFAMDGGGILAMSAAGSLQVNIDLVTTGTLVAGESSVPISVPSHYNASGTWSRPEADVDAITVEDVTEDGTLGDDTLPIPLFDFEADPRVYVICESADRIRLQAGDAPISSVWIRTN